MCVPLKCVYIFNKESNTYLVDTLSKITQDTVIRDIVLLASTHLKDKDM